MLNFVFILLTIFEIILTVICVNKFIELEKQVKHYNKKLILINKTILEAHSKIKPIIEKTNKVIAILTSKKVKNARAIIKYIFIFIEIIILIKAFKKVRKINYKAVRKILFSQGARILFAKTIRYLLEV